LAIIFPETYSSRAVVVGERIRERLKTQPINEELKHLRVTASVGVVSFPTHARDENDLMFKALEFLDVASQDGGDRVYNG
ncbi:diguanylate cyclase, partial [Candidatus Obscuribacterales bacterium]|nr:diguanylate cyclase [Candidatus Obscuribacterales bacterium]